MSETNHLPVSERRRLAKKSQSFCCDDCGMVASLLKPHNDTNSSEAEAAASEAKEIIKTMTLKVKHLFTVIIVMMKSLIMILFSIFQL